MAKVFIDDWRKPSSKHNTPDSEWILCKSYDDFELVLNALLENKKEWITEISFDYDLQDRRHNGVSCFDLLADIIEKYGLPIPEKIYVHSEYPQAERHFKRTAMSLSFMHDVDVDLIKINDNRTETIIKPFE